MKIIQRIAILVLACTVSTCQTNGQQETKQKTAPMNKTDNVTPTHFNIGPPITPAASLLQWLQEQAIPQEGRRKKIRIPVFVLFEDEGSESIVEAYIGTTQKTPESQAVLLDFDDSGMGIPLAEQTRMLCPDGNHCTIWLEGYWGALISEGNAQEANDLSVSWTFAALRCEAYSASTDAPNVYIE
jgi:hypothetical protein